MRPVRLLALAAALSIPSPALADDRAIRDALGDGLVDLISGAEAVTLYRIHPEATEEGECLAGYPIVTKRLLEPEAFAPIRERLLDPATWGGGMAMCFEPHHALVFEKGGRSWTFVICFLCNYLTIDPGEGSLAFGDAAPALEAALEKALGLDEMTPEEAREFLGRLGGEEVHLPFLERLDGPTAAELAKFPGRLALGVRDLTPEAAEVLARLPGELTLHGVQGLPPGAAARLAAYAGEGLWLKGLPADPAAIVELARCGRIGDREELMAALRGALEAAPPTWIRDLRDRIRARKIRPNGTLPLQDLLGLLGDVSGVDILAADPWSESEYEFPAELGERTVEDVLRWIVDPTVFDPKNEEGGTVVFGYGGDEWTYSMGVIVVGGLTDWPFDPIPPAGADASALGRPLEGVAWDAVPLADVLADVSKRTGIAIRIDEETVDPSPRVTLRLRRPLEAWRVLSIVAAWQTAEFRAADGGLLLVGR